MGALRACCREPFPLLADPVGYTPDTLDIWSRPAEMEYWLGVLGDQVQTVVEKAVASEGNSQGAHGKGVSGFLGACLWAGSGFMQDPAAVERAFLEAHYHSHDTHLTLPFVLLLLRLYRVFGFLKNCGMQQ